MLKIETVEETVYLEVNALEGYARKEYVDDAIDSVNSSISNIESDVSTINSELEKKANKSDLEGLATERYVDEKINNIPEVDLTPYATTESVDEKLNLKADVSDLDSLATKEELNLKADKSEVLYPSDIEGLATESYVEEKISSIDYSNFVVKSELSEELSKKVDIDVFEEEVNKKLESKDIEGLATEGYVDTKFNSIDLSPYATKEELEDKADISYVDGKIADIKIPSIEGLATEEYVDNKVNSIDLSEYATEQYVDSEIGKIYIPSLEGYATEAYVDNKVSSIDLSEYALTSDLSSAIESINSNLNLKADKTELEGLATEDYVNEKIDEKEVGITEPELVSKSLGSGKWMREGAYGLGKNGTLGDVSNPETLTGDRTGFYRVPPGSVKPEGISPNSADVMLTFGNTEGHFAQLYKGAFDTNLFYRSFVRGGGEWSKIYSDKNTTVDRNGVLHTGTKTPLDTLNVSDMADTVVGNDLLTVTSGAVYRAIAKLQNKIDELEGQVNELKALHDSRI